MSRLLWLLAVLKGPGPENLMCVPDFQAWLPKSVRQRRGRGERPWALPGRPMWCPRHQDEGIVWEASRFHGFYSLIRRGDIKCIAFLQTKKKKKNKKKKQKKTNNGNKYLHIVALPPGLRLRLAKPGWPCARSRSESSFGRCHEAGCDSARPGRGVHPGTTRRWCRSLLGASTWATGRTECISRRRGLQESSSDRL